MAEKNYKVEEVYAGCCTGTIRGPMVEKRINKTVKDGWKYESTQSVVGRKCCMPYYVLLIVFSKDETKNVTEV